MNTIRGWVIVKESGLGVPRLLVEILDCDPNTSGEEPGPSSDGDRLGCVVTNTPDGSFELAYDNAEFQVRNAERRPDLVLRVLAPEEPGQRLESRILYTSADVRQNAGLIEHYVIRLTTDQLLKHGIPLPSTVTRETEPASNVIARIKDNAVRHEAITEAAFGVAKQRMEAHRVRFAGFHQQVKPNLLAELSTVSPTMPEPQRFVRRGESPFEKTTSAMRKMIRETINSDDPARRPSAKGVLTLTADQVNELKAIASPDGSVPAAAVNALVEKNGQSARTSFVEANGHHSLCVPKTTEDECAIALLESHEPPILGPSPEGGETITAITAADIPRYLARLMEPVTAPEEDLLVGLMPVATRASVQNAVRDLVFPPSPADVPAFHDFTSLHLAFDTVWQEMLDEGVVDLVQDAYEAIVELGGDPIREEHRGLNAVTAVVKEARATMKAARDVRDHRGDGPDPNPPGGVSVTPTAGGAAAQPHRCPGAEDDLVVRDHRTGTTDIVVRDHRTTRVDPAERLPDLLQQLEKRLLGKYAFTVFAANEKERSINFGLLNTWRQVWTPLNYQAGPLVKSIPLAPKQTQKIVISRKTIKKRTRKEPENNVRVLKDEMSSTSRTEQEIARRAQTKNDFSIEHVSKEGVEPASQTTTLKAGHEASKSSDDIKKSFHEAVFKSAQEVKQERVVEVNTEEMEEFESTETTEISNPNDEIACTFLFYELERCYRVREKLHRCVPVILVAQEFPQPHEINAAWLVAHDWILKRVILDDSFLPTLNSLSQTAGNESALAEMRVNIQQQRCIVEQLREEVASARKRATLQQALLERSVFQKAGVVGNGRGGGAGGGGGIFGIVGDALESVASAAGSLVDSVGDMVFGGEPNQNQSNRQAMQERAQEAADQARELMFRLEREVTALNALTESYTKALREHHILLTEVARCCGHVMDNIMYYMQKIWLHEPADQRYFRLFNVPVPRFKAAERRIKIDFEHPLPPMDEAHKSLPRFGAVATNAFRTDARTKLLEDMEFSPLAEVADLDNLLGFKGNYMIFPLNESNPLTDLMMDPYIDRATGELVDPSDPSRWSLEEFSDYVCCLKDHLTQEELQAILPQLREQFRTILSAARRNGDVLVVPTNSLFIQALPDTHEVLGNFKRAHRLIDVKAAQAAHREKELENVRFAARILSGERGDPHIDKKVLIEGGSSVVVPAGDQ
jgi:hypothetical protein